MHARAFAGLLPLIPLALVPLILACGSDDPAASGGAGGSAFNGTISIQDNRFDPNDVTIAPGDSVTWRWDGSGTHTVTEGATLGNPSPLFDSGLRNSGTYGYRFTTEGTVPYHCQPHFNAGMRGTIRVVAP